jgi:uncharacterized membrane protein
MTVKEVFLLYLITAVIFFAIDLLWLGVFAKGLYNRHLGHLLSETVNWTAALLFYAIYIGGILLFVVVPSLTSGAGLALTALKGGLLGLFAYATFDLTNLALIRGWPVSIVWIDLAWGTALTGTVALFSVVLARMLL